MKFIATARGKFSAQEIYQSVIRILGKEADGRACVTTELPTDISDIDMIVCVGTIKEKLSEKISSDKLVGIDLVPTTDFFTRIACIPNGETAYLFSDSIKYANWMIEQFHKNHITHINIEILQAAALSDAEIKDRLSSARYIIGVENTVGRNGVLQKKFGSCIPADTTIIGAIRTASLESACDLMHWAVSHEHRQMLSSFTDKMALLQGHVGNINEISTSLKQAFHQEAAAFTKVHLDMEKKKTELNPLRELSQNLFDATKNIGDITGTIRHISAQTNLLALNATIEAARVGDQGRGFAVVANEIGKLAKESRSSTEKIQESVNEVSGFVNQITPELESLLHLIEYNQNIFTKAADGTKTDERSIIKIDEALREIHTMSGQLNADMQRMSRQ